MKSLCFTTLLMVLYNILYAQVPVNKETRHKTVFENSKIRVLNVLIKPADTTLYHIHSTPSVFICFTKTNTASQLLNGQPSSSYSVPENIYYEDLYTHQRTHRVWNIDTTTFHVMDVEILTKDTGFITPSLKLDGITFLFTQPMVRGYKAAIEKSGKLTINKNGSSFLLVAIHANNATVTRTGKPPSNNFKEGSFIWINAGEDFTINNADDSKVSFALFELK